MGVVKGEGATREGETGRAVDWGARGGEGARWGGRRTPGGGQVGRRERGGGGGGRATGAHTATREPPIGLLHPTPPLPPTHTPPPPAARLEVGTETGVDRSKSIVSYLLQFLPGNNSIQVAPPAPPPAAPPSTPTPRLSWQVLMKGGRSGLLAGPRRGAAPARPPRGRPAPIMREARPSPHRSPLPPTHPPPIAPQGTDNIHGCYGGTAALLAAADWVSGPSWDGRLALVVATDIAVYEDDSAAHATGGGRAAWKGGLARAQGRGGESGAGRPAAVALRAAGWRAPACPVRLLTAARRGAAARAA